jgi:hypothetical protein
VVRDALRKRHGISKIYLMFKCSRRPSEWCHGCVECAVLEDLLVSRLFVRREVVYMQDRKPCRPSLDITST